MEQGVLTEISKDAFFAMKRGKEVVYENKISIDIFA